MRHIIGYELWIGHIGDLRDPRAIHDIGIRAIVELADNEPIATLSRELIRFRFPLSDGGTNSPWLLRLAVDSVLALLNAKTPTLVCCSSGLSRSVCVTAAAIVVVSGNPIDEVLIEVAKLGPIDVSPELLIQMRTALGI